MSSSSLSTLNSDSPLSTLNSPLSKCVRCGTCRSVCPTFGVIQREPASARGKVSLCNALLKGECEVSQRFIKHITECTLCEACWEVCPNEVKVHDLILAARNEIVKKRGLSFIEGLILNGLDSDHLMPRVLKMASRFQGIFFKRVPGDSGLHRRFPFPLIAKERLVPPLAERFFLEDRGQGVKGMGMPFTVRGQEDNSRFTACPALRSKAGVHGSRPRIGFFVGCLINYIMPWIGDAALKVLKKAGADVVIPLEQRCCGMPALGLGDVETARSLALKNLETFERYELDYITTACATCGEGLKKR
ncbi:MAG: (Fe-S)-binding protein, partial [Deltaproteobacteria bacterium]|nr:(Fe-S)-binding protein [Deltaproteobacteria bacterium]